MKLKNTTDFADHFLRRLVSWCCRELELSRKKIREVRFRNSRSVWGGRAYWRSRITVCIGSASECNQTLKHWKFNDGFQIVTNHRIEVLVVTTAHELAHIEQFWRVGPRQSRLERVTEGQAYRLLTAFRANRESLLAAWNEPPAPRAKATVSIIDRRAEKAADDLARWQRKAKLAQTKIRKLKARVRYYERRQAAKKGTP